MDGFTAGAILSARLSQNAFPPSTATRATILERANAMAAHYGFPEWDAWKHLDAARMPPVSK